MTAEQTVPLYTLKVGDKFRLPGTDITAEIMGMGNCGICREQIADGVPIRYCGPGHTMAHKRCFEERARILDRSDENPT